MSNQNSSFVPDGDRPFVLDARRREFIFGLASLPVLATLPALGACATLQRSPVIAIHHWIGYETLYLARDFNLLPPGVALREGLTAVDSLQALKTGHADAACLTLDEVLHARAAGIALTVVLVFNVSSGADVVLARPGIKNLTDLSGKRIGVEKGAVGALMFGKMQEEAGLDASALTVIHVPVNRQYAAWEAGEIDAVVTYEPTATHLMRAGARRLFDSRQIPETIFDVLAVRSDRLDRHENALRRIVTSHFEALEHIRSNRQDALYRIAARHNVSPEEANRALAGVVLPSLSANRAFLASSGSRLSRAAGVLSALMTEQGLLAHADSGRNLFSDCCLPGSV
ncbi:ABC transporter substrate-binding protein [Aromatoleum bremense]|uniref:Transporter substrate-binding domain-containing protein n=1 Tax=Aromatoleum bremense TaxID=76115 RepID=A0ABX1NYL8_9RHOO|nr:ABC transporter substrate-binding protein [Aromatoleum bremense]NMG16666.1 transporter substrate-binding domain-containing protein [Aromatoleum bremense]QTQ33814.1 SsuA/THI5-like domain-containing protein [Aromatoleum bremense]